MTKLSAKNELSPWKWKLTEHKYERQTIYKTLNITKASSTGYSAAVREARYSGFGQEDIEHSEVQKDTLCQ